MLVSVNAINKDNAKRSLKRLETGANFLGIISNSIKQENTPKKDTMATNIKTTDMDIQPTLHMRYMINIRIMKKIILMN